MKIIIMFFLLSTGVHLWGQVGIGVSNPTKGAMLEVSSTSQGFLPPRLTTTQRDGINPIPEALLIYNTDRKCLQYWNTAKWVNKGCPPLPVPNPDLNFTCNGWQIPYTNDGNSATGSINGISVTASFSNYKNITPVTGSYCQISVNNGWWLGKDYIPSSMTIKFNKQVANMKVFQVVIDNGEKFWYILKNKGVIVKPYIEVISPLCDGGQFFINQAETSITNGTRTTAAIYMLRNVWFDEIQIFHDGRGNGSGFNFCIGNVMPE